MDVYALDRSWPEILARYLFLESLLVDKRVLELGCQDGTGAIFLKEHGAKQVIGLEREGAALSAARALPVRRGVTFQAVAGKHLDLPDADFDLVFHFELPRQVDTVWLQEIKRVLKPEGWLITALPNTSRSARMRPDRTRSSLPDLLELIGFLQGAFSWVGVLHQRPFLGSALNSAAPAAGDAPLMMDVGLVPGPEEVAAFVLVCGSKPASFEHQYLVQLPYQEMVRKMYRGGETAAGETVTAGSIRDQTVRELESRLQDAQRSAHEAEVSLREAEERSAELSTRLSQTESRLAQNGRELEALRNKVVQKERQLDRQRSEMQQRRLVEMPVRREMLNLLLSLPVDHPIEPEDLHRLIRQTVTERDALRGELAQLRADNERFQGETQELRHELEALTVEVKATRRQSEELAQVARSRENEVAEKLSWLEAARAEAERLEGEITTQQRLVMAKQKQIDELELALADRTRQIEGQEKQLANLKQARAEMVQKQKHLESELAAVEAQRQSWLMERRALLMSAEQRQEAVSEAQRRLELNTAERDELLLHIQEANERAEGLERELSDAHAQQQKFHADRTELATKLQQAQETLSEAKERESSWHAEREVFRTELNKRQEEVLNLHHQSTDEAKRAETLADTLSETRPAQPGARVGPGDVVQTPRRR